MNMQELKYMCEYLMLESLVFSCFISPLYNRWKTPEWTIWSAKTCETLTCPTVQGSTQQTHFSSSNLLSFPPQGLCACSSFSLRWSFFPLPPFWLCKSSHIHLWMLSLHIVSSKHYVMISPVWGEAKCLCELSSGPRRRLRLMWAKTMKASSHLGS